MKAENNDCKHIVFTKSKESIWWEHYQCELKNCGKICSNILNPRKCENYQLNIHKHIQNAVESTDFYQGLRNLVDSYESLDYRNIWALETSLGKVFDENVDFFLYLEKELNPFYRVYMSIWLEALNSGSASELRCPECYFGGVGGTGLIFRGRERCLCAFQDVQEIFFFTRNFLKDYNKKLVYRLREKIRAKLQIEMSKIRDAEKGLEGRVF